MTGNENSARNTTPAPAQSAEWRADSGARLLPKVTFGLGAAVLAGVVAVSVPVTRAAGATSTSGQQVVTTAGLDGPINAIVGRSLTTCCGGQNY